MSPAQAAVPPRTAVSDVKLAMLDAQGFRDICQRFMRRSEAALRIAAWQHPAPSYPVDRVGRTFSQWAAV